MERPESIDGEPLLPRIGNPLTPAETSIVVNSLRKHPDFERVSRCLLTDLVDDLEPETLRGEDTRTIDGRLIVLEGRLTVFEKGPPGVEKRKRRSKVEKRRPKIEKLQPGIDYWPGQVVDSGPDFDSPARTLVLQPTEEKGTARFVCLSNARLAEGMHASPRLARSLLAGDILNRVWICSDDSRTPIEALTFLLAQAIGDDWPEERVGVVVLRPTPELWFRADDSADDTFHRYEGNRKLPIDRLLLDDIDWHEKGRIGKARRPRSLLGSVLEKISPGKDDLWHVLFVNPSDPRTLPRELDKLTFHQIAYLTDRAVSKIPGKLARRLILGKDTVGDGPTRFHVFVPTILLPPDGEGGLPPGAALLAGGKFATLPIGGGDCGKDASSPVSSLVRDTCRLRFDVAGIDADWAASPDPASFATSRFRKSEKDRASASRWGRALTDRQVGVALSGGGACAFRAVVLLHELEKQGVPVDVIGGVSGGTLVSAYYAKEGMEGLRRCVRGAADFQRAALLGMISSWFIERQVDCDLGGARVEDLDVRLAAVAGALAEDRPPEARVVTRGTLGEAVRASGSMPLGFGPTEKGGRRFTDGAIATRVPVECVRLLGADVVIAFNFVPGPLRGNPLGDSAVGKLLYHLTPLGRMVDAWVSAAYLLQNSSREAMKAADVALEAECVNYPLTEMFDWAGAAKIVGRAAEQDGPHITAKVCELRRRWRTLGRRR